MLTRYLHLVDDALPGRIEGLYLVGSLALDDFKTGQSDIDFIAVSSDRLLPGELNTLERLHATLQTEYARPWFSGIYVTWNDLASNPVNASDVPFNLEGEFGATGGFDANPAVWLTLRNHPLSVRGPGAAPVWHDDASIRRWTLDNLNSYWRDLVERSRGIGSAESTIASDESIGWCVPGVARMHFTIATGDVTSKSGACRYALTHFPERWHPAAREALALRSGESMHARTLHRNDILDYVEFVIDDANALPVANG